MPEKKPEEYTTPEDLAAEEKQLASDFGEGVARIEKDLKNEKVLKETDRVTFRAIKSVEEIGSGSPENPTVIVAHGTTKEPQKWAIGPISDPVTGGVPTKQITKKFSKVKVIIGCNAKDGLLTGSQVEARVKSELIKLAKKLSKEN